MLMEYDLGREEEIDAGFKDYAAMEDYIDGN